MPVQQNPAPKPHLKIDRTLGKACKDRCYYMAHLSECPRTHDNSEFSCIRERCIFVEVPK